MWIVKSTLLALWLFGFGAVTFFYFAIYRHLPPNSAVGVLPCGNRGSPLTRSISQMASISSESRSRGWRPNKGMSTGFAFG